MAHRTVGLALGGGGLRGFAHIGVLQVLYGAGLGPDLIAGTSSGSLVAALAATGWEPAEMARLARGIQRQHVYDLALDWRGVIRLGLHLSASFYGWPRRFSFRPPSGLLRGDKLERLVADWTHGVGFEGLQRPVAVVATDLRAAEPVVFAPDAYAAGIAAGLPGVSVVTGASLAEACRASTALPGVFAPKTLDGRQLVDGGISDNVPVGVLRAMGAQVVVAVDLGPSQRPPDLAMWDVLSASMEAITEARVRLELQRHADFVIRPQGPDLRLFDLDRLEEPLAAGREAARRVLPDLVRLWAAAEATPGTAGPAAPDSLGANKSAAEPV